MSDWTDNPFAQGDDNADNPFSDPSVTGAQTKVPEYNPFDQPKTSDVNPNSPTATTTAAAATTSSSSTNAAVFGSSSPEPATMQPSQPAQDSSSTDADDNLPAWAKPASQQPATTTTTAAAATTTSGGGGTSAYSAEATAEAQRQRTAQQIETLRQMEYAERERRARHQALVDQKGRPPNFPNFPSWMRKGCIQPCFHIDISTEIPVIGQRVTRIAYYSWMFYSFTLVWNWICCLALLSVNISKTDVSAGVATAFLLLFMPCSYFCWFQQLYTGMRTDSSLKFGWFFLVMGVQFLASTFYAVGINGTGGSLESMTQEAAVGVASNQAVQRAAVKGAVTAASSSSS
ncbi:hypothetical protein PTSG_07985 [Salpingoeca rosetta]|uniref:Secretory carrier membrane protein n=1 Tax=Salpingoeca rosetta (strain ATCC 50818 / BSB-021) TaxID=946362 RepID=F2UGX3_SALR5|nr:uncharacterized protein PTSG_07985 [Salpingoeca rosetta]EGD75873.1 hypothetical protein PTSG_07985 [Salpingoeca rosetta]|eukprot:XP_004991794.1 hypothetical protein PTSG_07985 [Salpingoeca rosetta]